MKKEKLLEVFLVLFFIVLGIIVRLFPHAPNFTPIIAIALFGGFYLSKKIAWVVPVVVLAISDIFIGFYETSVMVAVYGSFLLSIGLGIWLKKHKQWYTIGGSAVVSAVLFFLVTNFAVWGFTPWYPANFSGLIQCYVMGLPFFKNTLLSSLFYSFSFFGVYELARAMAVKKWEALDLPSCLK